MSSAQLVAIKVTLLCDRADGGLRKSCRAGKENQGCQLKKSRQFQSLGPPLETASVNLHTSHIMLHIKCLFSRLNFTGLSHRRVERNGVT
jgi:hypothetical protein